MADVAVLLNLTGKLSFEVADPLISVINVDGPLLFYERLSAEKSIQDSTPRQEVEERLVALRNLLEARSLSDKDGGGKIRLLVTLDFTEEKSFPARRARQFISLVQTVFEQGNPLLGRLEYCFIFLAEKNEVLYRNMAYDGYSRNATPEWIACSDVDLNVLRDNLVKQIKETPEDEDPPESLIGDYALFRDRLDHICSQLAGRMAEVGLKDEFLELLDEQLRRVTTVGGFFSFDYDGAILDCISQLLGLKSKAFSKNCTFFILPKENSPASARRTSEIMVGALIQFLSTVSSEDFVHLLKSDELKPARLFVMDAANPMDVDGKSLRMLARDIASIPSVLERSKWKKDKKVKFKHFKANAQDPKTLDSHATLNDKLDNDRKAMFGDFESAMKVPFFFGKKVGDWSWYKRVLRCAERIIHFETINDRPLYDPPKRITDNEISSEDKELSYAEIESELDNLRKEFPAKPNVKGLSDYLSERQTLLDQFSQCIDTQDQPCLKKEMVKLGFFSNLFWIGLFSLIAFTLNYAFHFFWQGNDDKPWWIAVCFGVASVLFILCAIIGRGCVKSRLDRIHKKMIMIYHQMQSNLQEYLEGINLRVKEQNEADIRRKNIDEMQSKLMIRESHIKQLDLWIKFFNDLREKLSFDVSLNPNVQENEMTESLKFREEEFCLENSTPSLPRSIRTKFNDMTTKFTHQNINVSPLTCFATHLRFTEETR